MTTMETGADLAGVAALLQIGEELGISSILDDGGPFGAADLAVAARTPETAMAGYLEALAAAGLVEPSGEPGRFRVAADYADRRYQSGFLTWALNANRPLVEHAIEFFREPETAMREHRRDGRRVAVSAQWMSLHGVYPWVIGKIVDIRAGRLVDLGAGAAGLLIRLLTALPDSTGVAIDVSSAACAEAERAARAAGLADRLRVVRASIESLVEDPGPIEGADVIHGGFVFHDVLQDEATGVDVLRRCRDALAPGGFMAVNDCVPYAGGERERRFSALFTYMHSGFMRVQLLTEEEWQLRFKEAGFSNVECIPVRLPGGRLFIAGK